MKSIATYVLALCGWAVVAAGSSHAQAPGAPRSAVSPYLQLNRAGESPGLNYYGLVRPQLDANRAFQTLGSEINALGTQTAGVQANQANQTPQTGHPSSFMNHGRYFMNSGAGGQGGQSRAPTKGR